MSIPVKRYSHAAVALVSSCLLCNPSWAADDTARIRSIVSAAINPMMKQFDLPGMAVAVTVGDKAYLYNYGVASREGQVPVGDATLFELGSISKLMTATLASYAQVTGKLSLDDHPSKFMPQLKGHPIDKASLLHLGTYTAGGLPLQFPDDVADGQMVSYFQHWQAAAVPGAQRLYSNPSLGLFGHLAALALQGDFTNLMEQQLFPQLGMKSSYIHVPDAAMGNYAWGYDKTNTPVRMHPDILYEPTYGVVATAADVLHFVQVNITPSGLPVPLQRAIANTHIGYFAIGAMTQGLGWEQYRYPVTRQDLMAGNSSSMLMEANAAKPVAAPHVSSEDMLFNKTGSTRGFGAYVAFLPQQKIGIVMLANKSYPTQERASVALAILTQLVARKQ